jgi:GT2 family glycosyltransferase
MIDFVTVHYNEKTHLQTVELLRALALFHAAAAPMWRFIDIDNSINNRGFGAACNLGARLTNDAHAADILGFLNPDVQIIGPFIEQVDASFAADPQRMITGCRFGKRQSVVAGWALADWVCGAAFFVRRSWFDELGGFDQRFVWAWEETDMCMATESRGFKVKSIDLPIKHQSPEDDTLEVMLYKQHHLNRGMGLYKEKWEIIP